MRNRNILAAGLFAVVICGTCLPSRAENEAVTVAVIPFSARGIADGAKAAALTAAVTKELSTALCLKVAPEADVRTLLAETGLELTCSADSNSCAADLAKAAKQDYLVIGDLMQAGNRQFLSLQMMRVRRKVTVYRQRIETLDVFAAEDAATVAKHLASGFSCMKEDRFGDPPQPLKILPLSARKAHDEPSATAAKKAPEPTASSESPAEKPAGKP